MTLLERAWYKFEETSGTTVIDSSGNGYNGTIGSGTTINQTGKIDKSYLYAYNNVNSYANFGNQTWFDYGNYSLSGWFYITALGSTTTLFSKTLYYTRTSTLSLYFYQGHLYLGYGNGQSEYIIRSNSSFSYNTWYFFTVKRYDTTGELYVNGVLDVSRTNFPAIYKNSYDIMIGNISSKAYANHTFGGYVDDIRVYNFLLSQDDISLIYNNGNGTEVDLYTLRNPPTPTQHNFFSMSLGAEF